MPRPTKANELAFVLEHQFGPVCYAGIDGMRMRGFLIVFTTIPAFDPAMTYPKGAARVTFNTFKSYVAAMAGRFVNIPHSESTKRVCSYVLLKYAYFPMFAGRDQAVRGQ